MTYKTINTKQLRKQLVLAIGFVMTSLSLSAQVVYSRPAFPSQQDDITLYFNASEGNGALEGFTGEVYGHMGLITTESNSPTDWQYVQGNWGTADANTLMTREGPDLYSKSYNIEAFHGLEPGELVKQLAFVFRDASGSSVGRASDGSDIYLEVFPPSQGLLATVLSPEKNSIIYQDATLNIDIQVNKEANVIITDNLDEIYNNTTDRVMLDITGEALGSHVLDIRISEGTDEETISREYFVLMKDDERADAPAWISEPGLNYKADGTGYGFSLIAPDKEHVFLLCPENNFEVDLNFQMQKSVDGTNFWIELPKAIFENKKNVYQYFVDGNIKVADPYSEVVLDPSNDDEVDPAVLSDFPDYPVDQTSGILSAFDLEKVTYDWEVDNFERPEKTELVIYELLLRDFLADRSYASLIDTLDYLEKLGVNAIELMPINEFEGNQSWGYNISFHKAIDKYYGSRAQLKQLIDDCHSRGIAVVLDVVFNHAFSQSPLCRLYWDTANFRPTDDNPWVNVTAKHPYNVGYDMNHESPYTKAWVKNILSHLIEEYRFDGFRFDLSKGFTQFNSGGNGSLMSRYDQSRIDILTDYADHVWSHDPTHYVILEHFADTDEEKVLSNKGMLLWANTTHEFAEAAMGYNSTLNQANYKSRGFAQPHLLAYMESHDEERMGYKIKKWGNSLGDYDTKQQAIFTERIMATAATYLSIPGPKMLWQFGEMGYDYSINRCEDGSENGDCRLSPKPVRWDYLTWTTRKLLYNKMSAMLTLRNNNEVFHTTNFSVTDGPFSKVIKLNGTEMNALTLANFDVTGAEIIASFQHPGTWYEYFSGEEIEVSALNVPMSFEPGEYRVYTSKKVTPPNGHFSAISSIVELDTQAFPNPHTTGQTVELTLKSALPISATQAYTMNGQSIQIDIKQEGDKLFFSIENDNYDGYFVLTIIQDGKMYVKKLLALK